MFLVFVFAVEQKGMHKASAKSERTVSDKENALKEM